MVAHLMTRVASNPSAVDPLWCGGGVRKFYSGVSAHPVHEVVDGLDRNLSDPAEAPSRPYERLTFCQLAEGHSGSLRDAPRRSRVSIIWRPFGAMADSGAPRAVRVPAIPGCRCPCCSTPPPASGRRQRLVQRTGMPIAGPEPARHQAGMDPSTTVRDGRMVGIIGMHTGSTTHRSPGHRRF
jgi:hypothetical protein